MLSSGLLLDAGLNAEAQVLSTQPANNAETALQSAEGNSDKPSPSARRSRATANHAVYEALTPNKITRRVQPIGHEEDTSAKNTPRLLLDYLRNTDKPISDNTQEAPSNAPPSAGHKILGKNAASNRPITDSISPSSPAASHSGIQPAKLEEASSVSQPNSQNGFAPSPIQQQLEEMYRRDGLPVPQMNFQQSPLNPAPQPPTRRLAFPMPGSRPAVAPRGQIQRPTPMPSIAPNPEAATANTASPNSKVSRTGGLLSRLNPFKSRSTATPAPAAPPASAPASKIAAGKPALGPQRLPLPATLGPGWQTESA